MKLEEKIMFELREKGIQVVVWSGKGAFSFHANDASTCLYETVAATILDGVLEIQKNCPAPEDPLT